MPRAARVEPSGAEREEDAFTLLKLVSKIPLHSFPILKDSAANAISITAAIAV